MSTKLKARLFQTIEGRIVKTAEVSLENAIDAFAIRGFEFAHINRNMRLRPEMHDAPVFANLNGPMWDGDAVRYEDNQSYASLSL